MWNALPMPVPLTLAALLVKPGVTPAGQLASAVPKRLRKTMATCPGGSSPLVSGAYVIDWPVPDGMRAIAPTSSIWPARSTVIFTGVTHVFAMNAAKHPPTPTLMMSGCAT